MSERNSKLIKLEKQIEKYAQDQDYLIRALQLKDKLLLEFAVCMTAQKMPIPIHILKLMNTLYPNNMQKITEIEQEIDANVEAVK